MNKLPVIVCVIFLLLSGLTLVNFTIAQSSTKVSGYILDANGNGVSGSLFTLINTVQKSANGSGYYEAYVSPGSYHIFVYPPFDSYLINYEESGFVVGTAATTKNITLNTGLKVTGYIRDGSGAPVQGAIVVLGNFLSGIGSNVIGYYAVAVPEGTYTLWVHPIFGSSYPANFTEYYEYNFEVSGNTNKNITVTTPASNATLTPSPTSTPTSGTKISGFILDSAGHGISGATIIFNVPSIVPSVKSNSAGYYQIIAPSGTYHVNVWPAFDTNYIDYDEQGFIVESINIFKNITLSSGYKVYGLILSSSGAPVSGATIALDNFCSGWFSTSSGYYFLSVPAGTYRLWAHPNSGGADFPIYNEYNFVVNSDTCKNLTVTLTNMSTPTLTPSPTSSISSTPLPSPTPTLTPTLLSINAQATTLEVGSTVNFKGILSDQNGNPLGNRTVLLSFMVDSGNLGSLIGSAITNSGGEYSIQWLAPASGTFKMKIQYAGDQNYQGLSNTTALSIFPYQAQKVFLVESNSTVSAMAFNSSDLTLSFTVSGPSGTKGYVKTAISKTIVQNFTGFIVTLDGQLVNASFTDMSDCWIVTFTYSHSTHQVAIIVNAYVQDLSIPSLTAAPTNPIITLTSELTPAATIRVPSRASIPIWIYGLTAAVVMAVFSMAVLFVSRRRNPS